MPRTHEYTPQKGYEGTPIHGQKLTWTVPTSIQEALRPGPDTDGQPYFADEATLLAAAVNQLNILKGHTVQKATKPSKTKDEDGNEVTQEPEIRTRADAERIGRATVMRPSNRKRGESVKAVAQKAKQIQSKVLANLGEYSPDKLRFLVEIEQITQEQMDAELARRKSARAS